MTRLTDIDHEFAVQMAQASAEYAAINQLKVAKAPRLIRKIDADFEFAVQMARAAAAQATNLVLPGGHNRVEESFSKLGM